MTIHPKTSGAAVFGTFGYMLVQVLNSVHGVHLSDAANAAIPLFLATAGAWLVPGPDDVSPPPAPAPVAVIPVKAVPPPPVSDQTSPPAA